MDTGLHTPTDQPIIFQGATLEQEATDCNADEEKTADPLVLPLLIKYPPSNIYEPMEKQFLEQAHKLLQHNHKRPQNKRKINDKEEDEQCTHIYTVQEWARVVANLDTPETHNTLVEDALHVKHETEFQTFVFAIMYSQPLHTFYLTPESNIKAISPYKVKKARTSTATTSPDDNKYKSEVFVCIKTMVLAITRICLTRPHQCCLNLPKIIINHASKFPPQDIAIMHKLGFVYKSRADAFAMHLSRTILEAIHHKRPRQADKQFAADSLEIAIKPVDRIFQTMQKVLCVEGENEPIIPMSPPAQFYSVMSPFNLNATFTTNKTVEGEGECFSSFSLLILHAKIYFLASPSSPIDNTMEMIKHAVQTTIASTPQTVLQKRCHVLIILTQEMPEQHMASRETMHQLTHDLALSLSHTATISDENTIWIKEIPLIIGEYAF